MITWDEILTENAADHRATMESETCACGVLLVDHYYGNEWAPCQDLQPFNVEDLGNGWI